MFVTENEELRNVVKVCKILRNLLIIYTCTTEIKGIIVQDHVEWMWAQSIYKNLDYV